MTSRQMETVVDIGAPPARVWAQLTRFAAYPEWSRFIASIRGEPRVGERVTVELDDGSRPVTIKPVLLVVAENEELRWRGTLVIPWLFSGEHYFKLTALPDGRTRLTHGEQFGGLLVPLLWRMLDTRIRASFGVFNEALRARAEVPPS